MMSLRLKVCINCLLYLLQRLQSIFSCAHTNARIDEGKCYCPDCGQGLIYQWVLLRCVGCRLRRESAAFLQNIAPMQRFCPDCGESRWRLEFLERPDYFQLHRACLLLREEEGTHRIWWQSDVSAWVEKTPLGISYDLLKIRA
jgi:hypothetical protein